MAKRKRGPGRPKGSRNKDYQTITCHPQQCYRCGCTEFDRLKKYRDEQLYYEVDGRTYTRKVYWRGKCKACGQPTNIIERTCPAEDAEPPADPSEGEKN